MRCMRWLRTLLQVLMSAILIVQLSGCGTLLYPERRGQKSGRIDVGIAILDGVGLLLFIIPGLIAYGVDFTTGAIYLPGGRRSSLPGSDVRVVLVKPAELNQDRIEEIVARETGIPAKALEVNRQEVYAVNSTEELLTRIAEVKR
ncbi:MAG: polyribonucleotide nucleotidyltransferase [Deltaproteobacteria bacterium]|nr:polyribonucleotide nucleotidyltransferase [Deltaproteobacteria bacterium]